MMTRREKLNWGIAIVGLIASIISILAFVTGASSLPSVLRKTEPKPAPIMNPSMPAPVLEKKKPTPGDLLTAPLRNTVNWGVGRLTPRRHSSGPKTSEPANPAIKN